MRSLVGLVLSVVKPIYIGKYASVLFDSIIDKLMSSPVINTIIL